MASRWSVGLLNISLPWQIHAQEEAAIISWRECSKKHALSLSEGSSPVLSLAEGKAAAILTRGAYMEYVSTAKWRPAYAKPLRQAWNRWLVCRSLGEGWRLRSTFPEGAKGWEARKFNNQSIDLSVTLTFRDFPFRRTSTVTRSPTLCRSRIRIRSSKIFTGS